MNWFESFEEKNVVVTGASSGIGRVVALAFGAAGARVTLVARRQGLLEEVAAEIRARGGEAMVVPTDIGRPADVGRALASAERRYGRLDVVINNAGILIPATVERMRPADLQAMLRVNLFGPLHVMQRAVRRMRTQPGGGSIVNVASLAGRRGLSPLGGYCATKFALVGLTEALRMELHGTEVHVALVLPGVVDTPLVDQVVHDPALLTPWPSRAEMPPEWVAWAIFAAVRFQLVEISVPPGAALLEKLAALVPGATDSVLHWATAANRWFAELVGPSRSDG